MKGALGFETALMHLKEGRRVQRSGWNGKGMYVFIVWNWTFDSRPKGLPDRPFLAMKTADDAIVPWLASQTDLLEEDWMVAP